MQSIGAFIDKLFYLGIGIYFFVLSYKNKEKLGNKAAILRLIGIIFAIAGIIRIIVQIFK